MARSLLDEIRDIVLRETMFQRIYTAKVLDVQDPENLGRIKVKVFDLTWGREGDADAEFIGWASNRTMNGLLTPKQDDLVDIYFVGGRKESMAILGMVNDVEAVRPMAHSDGVQVLFQDRENNEAVILYDEEEDVFKISDANEKYVKGDTFKTQLDLIIALLGQVKTSLTSFLPTASPVDAAAWTLLITTPLTLLQNGSSANILSQKIKGA